MVITVLILCSPPGLQNCLPFVLNSFPPAILKTHRPGRFAADVYGVPLPARWRWPPNPPPKPSLRERASRQWGPLKGHPAAQPGLRPFTSRGCSCPAPAFSLPSGLRVLGLRTRWKNVFFLRGQSLDWHSFPTSRPPWIRPPHTVSCRGSGSASPVLRATCWRRSAPVPGYALMKRAGRVGAWPEHWRRAEHCLFIILIPLQNQPPFCSEQPEACRAQVNLLSITQYLVKTEVKPRSLSWKPLSTTLCYCPGSEIPYYYYHCIHIIIL